MHSNRFEKHGNRRWLWLFLMIVCISLLTGGCGDRDDDKVNTYGQDGYMGYSNSNPNLPGRHMALTYEKDGNMVKQVLEPLDGIERTQVVFKGADLYVNLRVNKKLSDSEVDHIRTKAQSIVQYNMPRYHVYVAIKK
ncbi:hypothetical protein [Paenibacillus sp. sgz302251]|uniref:hypothetical protein n=1 Tax=Paenibacillus sp. sgz302251 TaxID=3414493 RepID=UPI003C7A3E98